MTARGAVAAVRAILLSVLCVPGAWAQMVASPEPAAEIAADDPRPLSFRVAPFIWLPEIQGSISTRGATADVDVDIDTLFDLLGRGDLFASGGHFEVGYDRFSLFLDAFGGTARPTEDVTVGPRQMVSGTADLTMNFVFFEFGPAYRVLDWPRGGPGRPITIDALVGGRYMYFYQSITLTGSGGRFGGSGNATSEWIDPFVGGRFTVPIVGELDVVFRSDIGGFGVGSELAWNLIGGFSYGLPWQPWGARTSVVALYKVLDFDYQSGSGMDRVVTELDLRGPALGLIFDF